MTKFPYFKGDYLSDEIETIMDQEAREREASKQVTGEVGGLHLHRNKAFLTVWFLSHRVVVPGRRPTRKSVP